ncbi:MAG: ribbon-helix-helix protein, CopG family [Deltaproteobacteria bacterium]|nr:ribbon-helix-helix protein, CopG family [Deltaproteobacteria bacterium]
MSTITVNISFQDSLLADIDRVAKLESRSRSELLREAARMYIARKKHWDKIFLYGESQASQRMLSEADVGSEINSYRKRKSRAR